METVFHTMMPHVTTFDLLRWKSPSAPFKMWLWPRDKISGFVCTFHGKRISTAPVTRSTWRTDVFRFWSVQFHICDQFPVWPQRTQVCPVYSGIYDLLNAASFLTFSPLAFWNCLDNQCMHIKFFFHLSYLLFHDEFRRVFSHNPLLLNAHTWNTLILNVSFLLWERKLDTKFLS